MTDYLTLPERLHECPSCGASKGQHCVTPRGMASITHAVRVREMTEDELSACAVLGLDPAMEMLQGSIQSWSSKFTTCIY